MFYTKAPVHWHAPKLTGILPSRADFPVISFEAGVNMHSFHSEAFAEFQQALSSLNWLFAPFPKVYTGVVKMSNTRTIHLVSKITYEWFPHLHERNLQVVFIIL